MSRTEISTLGEFGLIERLTKDIQPCNPSTLRGVGDATMPTVIMLISFVLFRQIYLAVTKALGAGFLAVALAYPVGWILCSTLLIIRYSRSVLVRGGER